MEKEIEALLHAQEQGGGKLSKADRKKLIELHRKREKREQVRHPLLIGAVLRRNRSVAVVNSISWSCLVSRFVTGCVTAVTRDPLLQAKVSQMARASQSKHALTARTLPGDLTAEVPHHGRTLLHASITRQTRIVCNA